MRAASAGRPVPASSARTGLAEPAPPRRLRSRLAALLALALFACLASLPPVRAQQEEEPAEPAASEENAAGGSTSASEDTPASPEPAEDPAPEDPAPAPGVVPGSTAWRLDRLLGFETLVPRDPADRLRLLEERLTKTPTDLAATLELARVLAGRGDFDQARARLSARLSAPDAKADRTALQLALADLEHARLRVADEVLTLRAALSEAPAQTRRALFDRVLSVVQTYQLRQFDPTALMKERAAAFPGDWPATKALLEHAVRTNPPDAIEVVDRSLPLFPERRRELLAVKREVLLREGKVEAVRDAYLAQAVPGGGADLEAAVLDDLVELLRGRRELDGTRRRLESLARSRRLALPDLTLLVWILASENRADDAYEAIAAGGPAFRSGAGRMTLGQLLVRIGRHADAARSFLAAYLESKEPTVREGALYHLAGSLRAAPLSLGLLAPDQASGLASRGRVDTQPGFVSGLLSLAFNATYPQTRVAQLGTLSRSWSSKSTLLAISEQLAREFPASARALELFISSMDDLAGRGYHDRVARDIQHRLDTLSPSPDAAFTLELRLAAALRAAGKREREWAIYRKLLTRPPGEGKGAEDAYWKCFDLLAASLAAAGRHEDVLRLYWSELGRRPSDAALYRKFLGYLSTYKLVEEEQKVYEQAIRRFDDPGWYHKLSRWYLRHKRADAQEKLARRVVSIFDGPRLGRYLAEFVPLSSGRGPDSPDNRLALALYRDALERHPHELGFVTRLEDFYRARGMEPELDALMARYYFSDPALAERWIRDLARRGQLQAKVESAARSPGHPTARRFLADARMWQCRFEDALPIYVELSAASPGDRWLATRTASLLRSFGKLLEGAAIVERTLTLVPEDAELLTLLGELRIEAGDANGAAAAWNLLVETRPGDPARYLQAATVFWDYFDYGRAANLLEDCRKAVNEPTAHAVRLAAVHESAGAPEKAIDEYIRQLWQVDLYDWEARRRLVYLARARKLKPAIEGRFGQLASDHPADARLITAWAEWLDLLEDSAGKARLYLESAGRYRDIDLLETIGNYFETTGHSEGCERALAKLLEVSGGDREYRLRLAAVLEQRGRAAEARSVLEEGVELGRRAEGAGDGPAQAVTALLDLAAFYERASQFDQECAVLADAERIARGDRRRELRRRLGRRLLERGKEEEARGVFESILRDDPLEAASFEELASLSMKSNDAKALTTLYAGAIEAVRKSKLEPPERKARSLRLRAGLARRLSKLGRHVEAVDQWIEAINREPLEESTLTEAFDAAAAGSVSQRLESYYANTAAKSHKDYRYNVVLARIMARGRRFEEAAAQYAKAIVNEPHRSELRLARAEALIEAARYRDAAEEFRALYRLDNRNTGWLEKVALMFARAGDMQRARAELAAFVALGVQDAATRLAAARVYDAWGQAPEAVDEARAALERERGAWKSRDLSGFLMGDALAVLARWSGPAAALEAALEVRSAFEALRAGSGPNHVQRARLEAGAQSMERFVASRLPELAGRFATAPGAERLASLALSAARSDAGLTPHLLRFTETARLFELQCQLLQLAASQPPVPGSDPAEALRQLLASRLDRPAEAGWIRQTLLPPATGGRRAALLLRLAILGRLGDDPAAERSALEELISYRHQGASFHHGTAVEAAYLDSVRRSPDSSSVFTRLSAEPTLFRINWFLRAGLHEHALASISAMPKEPVWCDAKSLLTLLDAGRRGVEVTALFARLLGPLDLRTALGHRPDATRTLIGAPWFHYALRRADHALASGDNATADAFAWSTVEEHPLDAARQLELGEWLLARKKADAATARFQAALELSPGHSRAADGLARALSAAGKKGEARATWTRLIASAAASGDVALLAARSMEASGETSAARDALVDYVRARHGHLQISELDALLTRCASLQPQSESTGLDSLLRELAAADPARIELFTFVAGQKYASPALAEEMLRRAVAAVSSGAFPNKQIIAARRLELAAFLARRGDAAKALAELDAVLAAEPRHPEAGLEKLRVLARSAPRSAASSLADPSVEAWLSTLKRDRQAEESPMLEAAAVLEQEGLRVRADWLRREHYQAALAAPDAGPDPALELARVLIRLDEPARAVDTLDAAALRAPDEGFHERAAKVLEAGAQHSAALAHRERLRSRTPSDSANTLEMARLYAALGKRSEALELARGALFGTGVPEAVREDALAVYARTASGDAAETAACEAQARGTAASPWAARARARLALAAGDTAGYERRLRELATGAHHAAPVHRELGLHLLATARFAESRAPLQEWWRLTGDPQAALALFRALAAIHRPDLALASRTPPGCPDYDPYEDERSAAETPDVSSVTSELPAVKGAAYPEPSSYAEDAAGGYETLGQWGRAAALLRAGAELASGEPARTRLRERAAAAETRGAAQAEREAKRLVLTEGIEN
ncbi:MAG: hypothetical protein HY816_19640 [Candidatus Wallbacteria bacterium]|nr:hypothetical protein [Candidatus Wallbacteria bacterium]